MIYFIYDGSFEGLLTAIYDAFYSDNPPDEIAAEDSFEGNLFSKEKKIKTDSTKSDKVYNAIKNEISNYTLTSVYYAYLSEINRIETVIYNYLKLGFKMGDSVNKLHSNDVVKKIKRTRKKVSSEAHKMKGFLRFRTLENGIYYAPMEPDYNIMELLARHFVKRLADQNWIIHDLKREIAAIYNQKEWLVTPFKETQLQFSGKEKEYQNLWKEFFDSIALNNRKKPKLQRQNMPKRYWKHLIEK